MKATFYKVLLVFLAINAGLNAQEREYDSPVLISSAVSMEYMPPLVSRTQLIPAPYNAKEVLDGRSSRGEVIPGKDGQTGDFFTDNPHELSQKIKGRTPSLVFEAAASGAQPTDPTAAVGPDHYLVTYNTGFRIFDKSGNALTSQLAPSNIFGINGCCDLTVSYDNDADRWVLTLLTGGGFRAAVSDGPDPVNDGWYVYTFSMSTDYQKLSIWSDGYYVTANKFPGSTGNNPVVYALERDEMLAGDPNAQIIGFPLPDLSTFGFYSPQVLNVTDGDMPATGNTPVVFLQDDSYAGVSDDHMKVWYIDVDWTTPANSTISTPDELSLTPFVSVFDGGSFSNLPQPFGGSSIDALQAIIMNQAQFRKFSTYNSAVFNFVVNTDAPNKLAGIRWMELRQDSDTDPWTLHQEGTYNAPDDKHAWNASMAMDAFGNIGMGYTAMGGNDDVRVSSYYTGRYAADPLGTMTVAEEEIQLGNANIPGIRYGDYSKIDVDPSDDVTFWFVDELMFSGRKIVAGVFKLAPDFDDDLGVASIDEPEDGILSASEDVTITIFNYGENDQSNFDVMYQIDGGTQVVETYTGTVLSQTSEEYTFTAQADLSVPGQTYEITAATMLTGDENTNNDDHTVEVTHSHEHDLGVTDITSPVSGFDLSENEVITVEITNFGYTAQSNFDVSYQIDGNPEVVETVTATVDPDDSILYSFTQTGDFSEEGNYEITAKTQLQTDTNSDNDEYQETVNNQTVSIEDPAIEGTEFIVIYHDNNQFELVLTTQNPISEMVFMEVYNMAGQIVAYKRLEEQNGRYTYHLDMSYAAAGVYFVRVGTPSASSMVDRIIVK